MCVMARMASRGCHVRTPGSLSASFVRPADELAVDRPGMRDVLFYRPFSALAAEHRQAANPGVSVQRTSENTPDIFHGRS